MTSPYGYLCPMAELRYLWAKIDNNWNWENPGIAVCRRVAADRGHSWDNMETLTECDDDASVKTGGDVAKNRLVYVQGYVDHILQSHQPESRPSTVAVREWLTDTLLDSLTGVEKRFMLYGEKISSVDEEWEFKRMKKLITTTEHSLQAQLLKKQHSFANRVRHVKARECDTRHLHSDALRNCLSNLSTDLDLSGSCLMDELIASDVMSISDEESIRGKGSRRSQIEELVSCLIGRMSLSQFYHVLLPALVRDHPHLADVLLAEIDRLEELQEEEMCLACRVRTSVQVKRLATPLLMQKSIDLALHADLRGGGLSNSSKWTELRSVPDSDIIEAMKTKYPAFYSEFKERGQSSLSCSCISKECTSEDVFDKSKHPEKHAGFLRYITEEKEATEISEMSAETARHDLDVCLSFEEVDLELAYKMTARPRGICLIIINLALNGHHDQTCSRNEDSKRLARIFEKLEFIVVTKTNLTSSELKNSLREYANFNHTKYDAFVCCLLSYGSKDAVCGSDGEFVQLASLTSLYKASACPTLAGKPKIFFIDANRGDHHMTGLRTNPSEAQPYSRYIADEADFLIGHSTSPDCKRFWHRAAGSDYISALASTLDSESDRHDLLTCLMLVNQQVSRRNMLHNDTLYKQVPAPVFTLNKRVFLTTDPLWTSTEGEL